MFTLRTKLSIAKAVLLRKKSPFYIQFFVSGSCNLRCRQCNIVKTNANVQELTSGQIGDVARSIKAIGGAIVLLTGGEPFLRKDLPEIVETFKRNNLEVRLQTAGIATSDSLARCHDAGARDINISLDSLDADIQDYINGVHGSWARALSAIERVSDIFSDTSAICGLGCVVSRFNYRELPAIVEFATRIGWFTSLVPAHIATPNKPRGFRSMDTDFLLESGDMRELDAVFSKLALMRREGATLFDSDRFLASMKEFMASGTPSWRNKGVCDSPDLYFAVRPNGDFTTCCDYILPVTYNLADPDFPKLYSEGYIHKIADPIVSSCSGCHYGSYPEVTLSVRNGKAIAERAHLVLFGKKHAMRRLRNGEAHEIAETVRKKYSKLYGTDAISHSLRTKIEASKSRAD